MKTLKKIVYALQHICVPQKYAHSDFRTTQFFRCDCVVARLACAYVLWLRLHRLCKYMCRIL